MTSSLASAAMDTSGFSQIGRYGTISLMKHQEPNTAVTAFGIDTDQLSFGRDPACSVRLYYPDVSLVHCKIIFEERKAFLIVLGSNGLSVDGCKVYPSGSPSGDTTIPLANNSEFEIHGKRFRFTYPPKELRAVLLATPARPDKRSLRLSMIQSAQVFSPRPSNDPRENLRILKSPLKNMFKSPTKSDHFTPAKRNIFTTPSKSTYRTPVKNVSPQDTPGSTAEELEKEGEEEDIILVDGNHPRVVEDEKDLVILEDVDISQSYISPSKHDSQTYLEPPRFQPSPQTPVRSRSHSRNTLHRAVLIRSAQRAVLKAEHVEREREEEEEEMEVLETVANDVSPASDEEGAMEDDDENEAVLDGEDDEQSEEEEEREVDQTQGPTWRKSLGRLWPFRSSSPDPKGDAGDDYDHSSEDEGHAESETEEQDENQDIPAPLPSRPIQQTQTPIRRPLGSFMTPQVNQYSKVSSNPTGPGQTQRERIQPDAGAGRYSLGGSAQRIVQSEQVWKVRDIVVPQADLLGNPGAKNVSPGPSIPKTEANHMASPVHPGRVTVSEEERKAIQERRRSALRDVGTFFPSGVPGMGSPNKPLDWSPAKTSSASSSSSVTPLASGSASPFKPFSPMKIKEECEDEEEQMDTRSLLEKMKETVEGMKRRRSLAPATPGRGDTFVTRTNKERMSLGLGPRPTSPSKSTTVMEVVQEDDRQKSQTQWERKPEDDGEVEREKDVTLSLLRTDAVEDIRTEEDGVEASTFLKENRAMEIDEHETATTLVPVGGIPVTRVSEEIDSVIETDEAEEQEEDEPEIPVRRGKTSTPTQDEPITETRRKHRPAAQPKNHTPAASGGRKEATIEPEEDIAPNPPPRRGRKPAAEPEEGTHKEKPISAKKGRKPAVAAATPEESGDGPTLPRRGGRKATAVPSEDTVQESQLPLPARRGRTPKTAPTALRRVAARGKLSDESPDVGSSSGRLKRGAKTKPIEVVEEADDIPESNETEEVAPVKTKGRKKIVKEEDEGETEAVVTTIRNPRTKTTVVNTPAAKSRAAKKVPATAPAAIQQSMDKENTPGSDGSSIVDAEEPVKIRVSRTRKAVTGTVTRGTKIKQEEPEEQPPRGRVMRATRTRTKT